MKLDKDTFVKQQFWFLLGGYLLVWFIAVLWLKIAAGGPIDTAKKEYEKQTSGLKTAGQNPVNVDKFLPPWNAAAKVYNGHKSTIWETAWEYQKDMYDWPKEWAGKNMTTPQTPLSDDDRFNYKDRFYPDQIRFLHDNAPAYLAPVELAGDFNQVFQPQKWQANPTREEIWLTQEDYWVKRELLLIIWKTMAELAYMEPIPIDDKEEKPEGVVDRYRFANQSWEITLNLRKERGKDGKEKKDGRLVIGGDSTLRNIDPSHRPQPLTNAKGEGIKFVVAQETTRTEFPIRGESVGWNETRPFCMDKDKGRIDYAPLDGIVWENIKDRPIAVSQAFDLVNSPIRRLSALALAKQDCRTYAWVLQPNQELVKLDPPPEDPNDPTKTGGLAGGAGATPAAGAPPAGAGAPAGAPGGAAGGGMGMGGRGMGGMFGGGGPMQVGNPTPNNQIERNRYLQPSKPDEKVSPPGRHLPLAVRLVVEQSHMHELLLALVNSRLRIQITQVEYHHDKDYVPQSDEEKDKDKKDGVGPMAGGRFMGALPGMTFGGSMRGQRGGSLGLGMAPGGNRGAVPANPRRMGRSGMMGPRVGMGAMGMGGMSPSMMRSLMSAGRPSLSQYPGGRPKGMPQVPGYGDTGTSQTAQDQHDDNLVDLTIYGIATLYRHPDAPANAEQAGQAGQVAPPGGQPPPPTGKKP